MNVSLSSGNPGRRLLQLLRMDRQGVNEQVGINEHHKGGREDKGASLETTGASCENEEEMDCQPFYF